LILLGPRIVALIFAAWAVVFQLAVSDGARAAVPDYAQTAEGDVSQRSMVEMTAALAQGRPIIVMFSTPGCPYCHALRTEHLNELKATQQKLGVFFVEFDLSDRRPFDAQDSGERAPVFKDVSSPRDLARRLSVRVAPTLVFLGPEGELAERLIGYGARDFYAGYLDQRLGQARSRLRAP
jgi:thioredoxin-related protein